MGIEPRIALTPELSLSRLVVGTWRLLKGAARPDAAAVARLIDVALEQGMTSFDHADIYGNYEVEALFGEGLEHWGGRRESIELVTKCDIMLKSANRPQNRVKHYDTGAAHIAASIDRSLKNFGTDYLDLLLIHRPDPLMNADETAGALDAAVKAGKVRAVGVSNFTPSQFDLLASRLSMPLATNQIELSVLEPAALFDGRLDHAQRLRYAPMAWSPLGGGALFAGGGAREERVRAALGEVAHRVGAADIAAVALAWLLRHPSRPVPVLGTTRPERLAGMAAALSIAMERQDWFAILEAGMGRPMP
jgi:predicted oxidoreductase